jgi:hypothetical protein
MAFYQEIFAKPQKEYFAVKLVKMDNLFLIHLAIFGLGMGFAMVGRAIS